MTELFKLFGTIAIDNSKANSAIDNTTDKAQKSEGKISGAFKKVGSSAVAVGKVVATGLAVAGTAVIALASSALQAYADYEQLVGGVETLFGAGGKSIEEYAESVGKTVDEVKDEYDSLMQAQKTVLDNASMAYKNAGMSANEYMETVTSFSASLIQSVGGDTEKAAEKANQAIIDMSDNANKMGSDMESIQNAYQGFAKQNYTMLDNLKLGYGGTKEEMQRLLKDAEAISGIKYDVSSYADVVDAIHVIQNEMGITGTTANEAATTISGSASSMKSAWANLVAGFGNENANLQVLINNFVDSAMIAFHNIAPRLEIILSGIAEAITKIIPKITAKLPGLINSLLPPIIEGAVALINGLVAALPTLLSILLEQMPFIISQIGSALLGTLPQLFGVVQQLLGQIANFVLSGIAESGINDAFASMFNIDTSGFLGEMEWVFGTAIPNLLGNLKSSAVSAFAGQFKNLVGVFSALKDVLQPLVEVCISVFMDALMHLIDYVTMVVVPGFGFLLDVFTTVSSTILTAIKPAIDVIVGAFTNLRLIINEAIADYIIPLISNFIAMIQQLWLENQDKINLIGELFSTVFNTIAGIVQWFVGIIETYLYPMFIWLVGVVQSNLDNIKAYFQSAFDVIGGIVQFFIALFQGDWSGMWNSIVSITTSMIDMVKNWFTILQNFLSEIMNAIWSKATEIWENIKLSISQKITAIVDGIKTKFTEAKDAAVEVFTNMKDAIGGIFEGIWSVIKGVVNSILGGIETMANGVVSGINVLLGGVEDIANAAGELLGFDPISIRLEEVSLPRLAKGGIVTRATLAEIGEDGAEAIVPLENNTQWIQKVSNEMRAQGGYTDNTEVCKLLNIIIELLKTIITDNDTLPDKLLDAMEALHLDINNREFARLVRAVR